MGRTLGSVVASPSRSSTILRSLGCRSPGNVDQTDTERLALPRQRLGRCGIFAGPVSVEQALHDLLRVTVWCLFAERLLQSTAVGWGQSRRVGPLEQLGGTTITRDHSDRWVETQAVLRGISMGRDTVHVSTGRTSPEMFTKMESAEVGLSASPPVKVQVSEGEKNARWERRERNGSRRAWEEEDLPVFCEYAAPSFAHLRGVYGMSSSRYRRSFRKDSKMIALASNSKSAQTFMFSGDGKYMLKSASESELESMLRFLPRYTEHVTRRQGSLISRFYGIYRVTSSTTKRSTIFIASSNVFSTGKRIQERYDLKGSVIGRRAMSPKAGAVDPTTMMKDLDLVESANGKMRLASGCKKRLLAELTADADFLAGLGIMDYSLLVGVHRPDRPKLPALAVPLTILSTVVKPIWAAGFFVLKFLPGGARKGGRRSQVGVYPGRERGVVFYVGIIDVLQRYNARKMLERGAKGVLYNRHEISAVPPQEYRDRFVGFVDRSTE